MPDNLFVTEDEDTGSMPPLDSVAGEPHTVLYDDIDSTPEDPVVEEIPIYLNDLTGEAADSKQQEEGEVNLSTKTLRQLCLFQYISQLASKPLTNEKGIMIPGSRIKPKSRAIEIDVPLDTSKFYDSERAEEWDHMAHETYGGTLMDAKGNYVLCVKQSGDKKEIVLTPIEQVCQIRPVFHHIDNFNDSQKSQKELLNGLDKTLDSSAAAKNLVQVVQMTAKSTGSENEIRYSEAILTFKRFQDEEFINATWVDKSEKDSTHVKSEMYGDEELKNRHLEPLEKGEEYISKLLSDV